MNSTSEKITWIGEHPVLVTGASGFIGTALCEALTAYGAQVHGVSRSAQTTDDVQRWQVDLADPAETNTLLRETQPSIIFHLASHVTGNPAISAVQPTLRDNLLATINILDAASKVSKPQVVLAGSIEERGSEDSHEPPVSPYAAAKSAANIYARLYGAHYEVPVVTLRVSMTYGPGQRDWSKLVPYVITSLLNRQQPRLSSGSRRADWIYVDDVVAAFIAAACTDLAPGESLDVGSGHLASVRSVAERLTEIIGTDLAPEFGALEDRPLEHQHVPDVQRTFELIGWKPTTPLDVGLVQTVQWYRKAVSKSRDTC